MVMNRKNLIFTVFVGAMLFLGGISLSGRDVPKLPVDSKISAGVLPNGMNWYVVANSGEKGFADFALVCRGEGNYVSACREVLSLEGRIEGRPLQKFLSSNAVAPSYSGYVSYRDDAVVFNFEDVMLSRKASLADSLLLAVFDIADELSRGVDSVCFAPSDMAVMVSGDVNAGDISSKMRTFSLMIPRGKAASSTGDTAASTGKTAAQDASKDARGTHRPDSLRGERPRLNAAKISIDTLGSLCRIGAEYSFPRMPRELIASAQYAVMDKMAWTFGNIARRRLTEALSAEEIPFASIRSSHISSGETAGEESVKISFCTLSDHSAAAQRVFGEVMSSLKRGEISEDEIALSSAAYAERCADRSSASNSNAEYIRLCLGSFLYGSPLATEGDLCEFCQRRVLPDSVQLKLMRGFSEALVSAPSEGEGPALFCEGWNDGKAFTETSVNFSDTLLLPGRTPKKLKHKLSRKEPLSGGEIWTWQNGLKVYYKRVSGAKGLSWGLTLNKGYAGLEGLVPGEAAFLSDLLKLTSVCGVSCAEMQDILAARGISYGADVSLYSTSLRGKVADASDLDLLFKWMGGLFSECKLDDAAVSEYGRNVAARKALGEGSRNARIAAIDSLICSGNPYSRVKMYDNFSDGTVSKASKLLGELFSNAADGFLVLSGDVDPDALQKTISFYAGNFPVGEAAASRRPSVRFQPVSGWSTTSRKGDRESIDVLLTASLPMTADNLCTSRLAACMLDDALKDCLVGTGFHTRTVSHFALYPEERFSVLITLDRAPEEGFAWSEASDTELLDALRKLREGINSASSPLWTEEALKAYKQRLLAEHATDETRPEWWVETISLRYSAGRDLQTKIDDKTNAVTLGQIQSLLKKLSEGSRIELVVSSK